VRNLADDMVGRQSGDIVDIDVELPPDFEVMEGRGEAAVLRLDIYEVKRRKAPRSLEQLAEQKGFTDVEALREDVRNRLLDVRSEAQDDKVYDEIVLELLRRIE